jgi:hypothetical protein
MKEKYLQFLVVQKKIIKIYNFQENSRFFRSISIYYSFLKFNYLILKIVNKSGMKIERSLRGFFIDILP